MKTEIQEPEQRISPKAVAMWRTTRTIGHLIGAALLAALFLADHAFHWWSWVGWVLYGASVLTVLSAAYLIGIEPAVLLRTWRYGISEEYVQLKHGAVTRTQVLVPMAKVEYVTTNQGPIQRKYDLYNVKIGTMASTHVIPAVPEKEAAAVREKIARLAQVKDGG